MADDSSVVGRTGTLTIGTRGSEGAGEVLVKLDYGSQTYLAWSDEPLAKGREVLIIGVRGARVADVVGW